MFAATRATRLHTSPIDHPATRLRAGTTAAAGLFAGVLLLSLAPIPHAAALSNHTWRVELAAALFLLAALAFGRVRFCLTSDTSQRVAVFVTLFAVWGSISVLWAKSSSSVAHHTIVWVEYALFFALASEILRRGGRSFLIWTFLWFVAVIGAVTMSDYLSMPDFKSMEGTLRLRYSAYGELLVAILPVLWLAASYMRRRRSWLIALLPAALGWTAAMLSLSKGVFIAGIAGSIFAFGSSLLFGKRIHRRRLVLTAGVWLALTIAVQAVFSLLTPIPATIDYISGKADKTRETSTARLFIWRTTVPLVRDHWLAGVGADNYGIAANEGRAEYRSVHPIDPPDEPISDFLVERAHSEPLQVLLELGVPGLILFAIPFALFAYVAIWTIVIKGRRPSLFFWAACGGMAAFAVSSMVSSFSFRIVQNGIAFFLIFAVAVFELSKTNKDRSHNLYLPRPLVACVLSVAILVLAAKGVAEYSFVGGDRSTDHSTGSELFSNALTLDPDYAAAHYRLSRINFENGDHSAAAKELRAAIAGGMGVVLTFSDLAECYEKAGDRDAEFSTFDEALRIYPRSVFLHVRYSVELDKTSRTAAADQQLAAARDIDKKQANGWYSLITRGSVRTFYDARTSDDMAAPAELAPDIAVIQYLDKNPGQ
jgi:O-antigen ligase